MLQYQQIRICTCHLSLLISGKKRAQFKRAQKVQMLEKKRDVIEGRNVLVYRGVPYVRYNAR